VTPGEIMDLSVHPFTFPTGSQASLDAISKRYGHAKQIPGEPFQLPDTQGLHVTDYQAALELIWEKNPTWFAVVGLGNASGGDGHATQEEFEDAKYAQDIGDRVLGEAKRISLDGSQGSQQPPPEAVPSQVVVALKSLADPSALHGLTPVQLSKLKRVVSFFTGVKHVLRS
jgi:hypothetical protein